MFHAERTAISVDDLRGNTPEVEAGLWRFVFDLDLVGQVNYRARRGGRAHPLAVVRPATIADGQRRGPALRADPGHGHGIRGSGL